MFLLPVADSCYLMMMTNDSRFVIFAHSLRQERRPYRKSATNRADAFKKVSFHTSPVTRVNCASDSSPQSVQCTSMSCAPAKISLMIDQKAPPKVSMYCECKCRMYERSDKTSGHSRLRTHIIKYHLPTSKVATV